MDTEEDRLRTEGRLVDEVSMRQDGSREKCNGGVSESLIGDGDLLTKRVDEAIKFDYKAPIDHKTPMEADIAFRERYEQAQTSDRWMAAVWCIDDGKVLMRGLTTSNFPKGDFAVVIELLTKELAKFEKSESNPPVPEPLPKAKLMSKPNTIDLMTTEQTGEKKNG